MLQIQVDTTVTPAEWMPLTVAFLDATTNTETFSQVIQHRGLAWVTATSPLTTARLQFRSATGVVANAPENWPQWCSGASAQPRWYPATYADCAHTDARVSLLASPGSGAAAGCIAVVAGPPIALQSVEGGATVVTGIAAVLPASGAITFQNSNVFDVPQAPYQLLVWPTSATGAGTVTFLNADRLDAAAAAVAVIGTFAQLRAEVDANAVVLRARGVTVTSTNAISDLVRQFSVAVQKQTPSVDALVSAAYCASRGYTSECDTSKLDLLPSGAAGSTCSALYQSASPCGICEPAALAAACAVLDLQTLGTADCARLKALCVDAATPRIWPNKAEIPDNSGTVPVPSAGSPARQRAAGSALLATSVVFAALALVILLWLHVVKK